MGIIGLVGGLSGELVLRGTDSSGAMAAIGGVFIVIGIFQLVRGRQQEQTPTTLHHPYPVSKGGRSAADLVAMGAGLLPATPGCPQPKPASEGAC